ncbi:ribonuclease J [Ligilactobacillus acidipiscis]|jgi:ribonuclease J|uniref:ribonuclease J n=1 Tax=Ligilactobacillus acidipiscis TaxID=89059 RepID=UPI002FD9B134
MSEIKISALGGVRENGKNMYIVEIKDEIFILDCGLKYPENELLGIDTVIPDFDYLRENSEKIVGVFLSHGHADAIGALPYFLSEFNVPVFGSEFTIALAKIVCENEDSSKKFNDFHVINADTEIDFENATVSFFSTTHSVPESLGIVIKTNKGNIVYTGDFKFDQTATDSYRTDFGRLAEIGKEGVIALLSDSANAENPSEPVDEHVIADLISETFEYHKGRVVVACVASNLMRVQQVLDAAAANERKVTLTGFDAEKVINTALKMKKLQLPKKDLLIKPADMSKYAPEQLVILEAGRAGEPLKSLYRMATGKYKGINLSDGDLAFITTTPSHAMDTKVAKTRDMIYRSGAEVKAISDEYNSSGHASKRDLQLLINLLKPKYVVPIQGEYRLLVAHAESAEQVGIKPQNIFLLKNGDLLEYDKGKMIMASSIEAGNTMIDGSGVGDIGNIVLRDRKVLSDDGIFIAVVTIDRKKHRIIDTPKITSRGFVFVKASKDLMTESGEIVKKVVQNNLDNKEFDWSHLKQDIRENLNHYLYEQTHRHPVIFPIIMEVNQHRHYKKKKQASK